MKKLIKLEQIELNEGQIDGLKSNPRVIDEKKYKKLVQSIKELPEMLEHRGLLVYPNKKKYVTIGGNMRLRALEELGYKEVWCEVLDASTSIEQLNEMIIKDNLSYGLWDWDALANDWNEIELKDWGMDLPSFEQKEEKDLSEKLSVEYKIEVECDNEEQQESLYNYLKEKGYICRVLTL